MQNQSKTYDFEKKQANSWELTSAALAKENLQRDDPGAQKLWEYTLRI